MPMPGVIMYDNPILTAVSYAGPASGDLFTIVQSIPALFVVQDTTGVTAQFDLSAFASIYTASFTRQGSITNFTGPYNEELALPDNSIVVDIPPVPIDQTWLNTHEYLGYQFVYGSIDAGEVGLLDSVNAAAGSQYKIKLRIKAGTTSDNSTIPSVPANIVVQNGGAAVTVTFDLTHFSSITTATFTRDGVETLWSVDYWESILWVGSRPSDWPHFPTITGNGPVNGSVSASGALLAYIQSVAGGTLTVQIAVSPAVSGLSGGPSGTDTITGGLTLTVDGIQPQGSGTDNIDGIFYDLYDINDSFFMNIEGTAAGGYGLTVAKSFDHGVTWQGKGSLPIVSGGPQFQYFDAVEYRNGIIVMMGFQYYDATNAAGGGYWNCVTAVPQANGNFVMTVGPTVFDASLGSGRLTLNPNGGIDFVYNDLGRMCHVARCDHVPASGNATWRKLVDVPNNQYADAAIAWHKGRLVLVGWRPEDGDAFVMVGYYATPTSTSLTWSNEQPAKIHDAIGAGSISVRLDGSLLRRVPQLDASQPASGALGKLLPNNGGSYRVNWFEFADAQFLTSPGIKSSALQIPSNHNGPLTVMLTASGAETFLGQTVTAQDGSTSTDIVVGDSYTNTVGQVLTGTSGGNAGYQTQITAIPDSTHLQVLPPLLVAPAAGDTFDSSLAWACSGVPGWSTVSAVVQPATPNIAVVTLQGPAAATPPNGPTGTLVLTAGGFTVNIGVGTPTITVSPPGGFTHKNQAISCRLTGSYTTWSQEASTTLFTLSGGDENSGISNTAIGSNSQATIGLTTGLVAGTEVITDNSTGATTPFTVT